MNDCAIDLVHPPSVNVVIANDMVVHPTKKYVDHIAPVLTMVVYPTIHRCMHLADTNYDHGDKGQSMFGTIQILSYDVWCRYLCQCLAFTTIYHGQGIPIPVL